jgi:hypothetical protein
VPLRIALDLDGVLADMEGELARQAELLFGETMMRRLQEKAAELDPAAEASASRDKPDQPASSVPDAEADANPEAAPPLSALPMTTRQHRRLWRHIEGIENFWESLSEIEPGAVSRLAAVAIDRRWEVLFLTKRPETAGSTAQVQTQRWLESKGFALPSVYVVQGSRGRVAAALELDFVVDDRPENCLDIVADSKARAVLVWRESEKQLPITARRLGIGVVRSVDECLNILTKVDASESDKSRVVERIMQLLGL